MTAREPDIAEAVEATSDSDPGRDSVPTHPPTGGRAGNESPPDTDQSAEHFAPAGGRAGNESPPDTDQRAEHFVPAGGRAGNESPVGPAPIEPEMSDEDHERQLEHDIEQLTAKAEKAQEYLELAQRTRADFENYRKRAAREAAAAQERGVAKLAKELLPAVDNLDRALEAAQSAMTAEGNPPASDNGTATLVSGIKLVHEDVINALARAGIERFSPKGERFDPQQHEAIAQQPVQGAEPGTVVEVYQRGYRLGESVIRPARVVVAA